MSRMCRSTSCARTTTLADPQFESLGVSHFQVNRCICREVPFAEALRLNAQGLTLDEIRARTGAGGQCGLCLPYLRAALVTGRAALPVMSEADLNRLAANPPAQEKRPASEDAGH